MVKGKVVKMEARQNQYGTFHHIALSDGIEYGVGKYPPKGISEGDYVQFEATQKGRFWNVDAKSIQKIQPSHEEAAAITTTATTSANSYAKKEDAKQLSISKQAARNTAVNFMVLLGAQDALPVGKSATGEKRFTALCAVLEKLTEDFFNYSQGKSAESEAAAEAEVEEPAEPDEGWTVQA